MPAIRVSGTGESGEPISGSSKCTGFRKPKSPRYFRCIGVPTSSAIFAAPMFDEWIMISGTLNQRFFA